MHAAGCRPRQREFLADSLTPLAVYRRLSRLSPVRFLLESVAGGAQVSRFSFLGAAPRVILRLWADRVEIEEGDGERRVEGAPLSVLRRALGAVRAPRGEVPFLGGWVGYFGYDWVRLLESLPARPPDPFGLPIAVLARFDSVVVFDHAQQRVIAVANEIDGEVDADAACRELDALTRLLVEVEARRAVELPNGPPAPPPQASLSGPEFRQAVGLAKEHIAAGDIFQVVLARRFRLGSAVEPAALYGALRRINPSPYMVLFEAPEVALVGASPEMLVKKSGGRVESRPIAGTRRRGVDAVEDGRLAAELLADPKERAEHVMLVDLGRNDLGRVCRAGSVEVTGFLEVERYSHVMHLCSTVEGELLPDRDALDVLCACFPAGTVSGAPKIRAMELIDELEPEARGPYAGAVGYFSHAGDLDACITIRTLVAAGGEVSVTAGAGIVADSDPAAEERETESKAAALLAAVALARQLQEGATE